MGKVKKKPYIRYVILGILATLMVGCIIRIAMPNREWNYTGSYTFAEGESYTEEPVFEHISLGTGTIPEATLLRKGNLIQKSRYLSIFRWGQEYTGWSCPTNAPGMPSRSAM